MRSKIIVTYFSASGVTAKAAKDIADAVGGDLYEIKPEKPYVAADLDWTNKNSRSTLEMNDPNCRPVIAGKAPDMAAYDTIFIGFPVWWYVEPRIVDTFLESHDFSGKTLIPFATSGGTGIARAERSLRERCPAAKWLSGKLVRSDAALWAKSLT